MSWAFGFLLLTCFAGVVAFGGVASGTATSVAWILFAVFIVLMIVKAVSRALHNDGPT